jgi:hypothetical protein
MGWQVVYQKSVGVYCFQLQGRSEPTWERGWLNGNGGGPPQKIGVAYSLSRGRGDAASGVAREPWALNGTTVSEYEALNL